MSVKNIKELKIRLRAQYRSIREKMAPAEKTQMDQGIAGRIWAMREYRQAQTFFTYVSKPIEVDTVGLILRAMEDGKAVVVPRCVPGTFDMEFYRITSMEQLEKGSFGVLEPVPDRCEKWTDFSEGFCIVPGLCFDSHGYRLGYGKGYYDRFLSNFGGYKAGVCYSSCIQWNLPHGYYDRPVDVLVTEKYIRRMTKPAGGTGKAQGRGNPGNRAKRKPDSGGFSRG